MTSYELKLDQFSGPTEKLLELIEAKKLDITEINLAEVTADFLKYIESLNRFEASTELSRMSKLTTGGVHPKILADFISVAAKLLVIKSRILLPQLQLSTEEERGIADLQSRLKFYQEFRKAEHNIRKRWQKKMAFGRPYMTNLPPGFYLTDIITPHDLEKQLRRLTEELQRLLPEVREEERQLVVTLEEKISELLDRLNKTLQTSFRGVVKGKEKSEVVVLFLALLHLLKESLIKVEQETLFSDIKITKS